VESEEEYYDDSYEYDDEEDMKQIMPYFDRPKNVDPDLGPRNAFVTKTFTQERPKRRQRARQRPQRPPPRVVYYRKKKRRRR